MTSPVPPAELAVGDEEDGSGVDPTLLVLVGVAPEVDTAEAFVEVAKGSRVAEVIGEVVAPAGTNVVEPRLQPAVRNSVSTIASDRRNTWCIISSPVLTSLAGNGTVKDGKEN